MNKTTIKQTKHIGDYKFEVVHNPMQNLSGEEQLKYAGECILPARDGFGNPDISAEDIQMHVLKASSTIFVRDSLERVVGFSSSNIENVEGTNVIYLQGVALSKEIKGLWRL